VLPQQKHTTFYKELQPFAQNNSLIFIKNQAMGGASWKKLEKK